MTTLAKQPQALYLIVCIQMWECFSFYGMRVLLVLYMINQLNFTDTQAFGVFALYTGLVELGGMLGGMIADKFLGLRRAISLGGWLIMLGHLTLALGSQSAFFFPALALIIVGSSLFSTNLSALLGLYYEENDPRRESGFTYFYAGINLGALLASLLCGYIGEQYGWHYGFGLAAIGMLIGNLTLYSFGYVLNGKGLTVSVAQPKRKYALMVLMIVLGVYLVAQGLIHESYVMPYIPLICFGALGYVAYQLLQTDEHGWRKIVKLMLYLIGLALFFAAEEQAGSSLTLFSDRHASGSFWGIQIPSSAIISVNPAVIILFGTVMNAICGKLKFGNFPFRIVIPFGIASLAFAGLAASCTWGDFNEKIPILFIMGMMVLISFAELMIGPAVYCLCSEAATHNNQGMVMGLVPIGFSLASVLGGYFSKWMAIEELSKYQSLEIYQNGFFSIAVLLLASAIVIGSALIWISRLENKNEESIVCEA